MSSSKDGGKRGAGVRHPQAQRDGAGELRRFEPVSDELVLAAVERAELHRERQGEGVMMSDIAEHLGFVHGSWTTRRLRPQIDAFIAAGLLVRSRRHGVVVWGLTSSGRRRAERGDASALPESPQHRVWRYARALAAERINGVCEQASGVLEEAIDVLDSEGVHSDVWFALAERLQSAGWQLGSAMYCLSEWPEPNDDGADVDDRSEPGDGQIDPDELGRVRYRRGGRRNVWKWTDA
ncbi:MAG TPA: hypothetical protein VGY30_10645 [Solirubrobacteraceae bacterium]|jgi:hypothetical protein|nr:hypothetical protein [Solirubrobacteraceae bacterium]